MKAILLGLLLLSVARPGAAATLLPADRIDGLLLGVVQGRNPDFGSAVAPAQSLDTQKSPADREAAIVARIGAEIEQVTTAFGDAPADAKIARTRATVAGFSPETAQDGASRSFEGSGPSLSLMRQVLFVPAAGADPVARVMQIVSSFERSPKTDDTYYEYGDPADLKASSVTELPGSATSWTTRAQPPMTLDKVYALKKCRHIVILGWYCNTSLYQRSELGPGAGGGEILTTILRPLPKGADNPKFTDDRAQNIVDGYTALYAAVLSGNLVLVYNFGIQSKADAPSQQSRLDAGHKEEYRQLVSRIEADLGTGKLPF